jgi:hypothetical protein
MGETLRQYDAVIAGAREVFLKKAADYGTSWRVLRPISVVDQIYIKARRIRQLQQSQEQLVADSVPSEFEGIINYSIIGLIQLHLGEEEIEDLSPEVCARLYEEKVTLVRELMNRKNHDYGEAWREMSQESFVDLIMMKTYRMRQIIRNDGKTLASEGLDANYMDIMNYAVFGLILLHDKPPASNHPTHTL